MAENPEAPMRLKEAKAKYGLSNSTFYRKFEDGSLTRYKFGGATCPLSGILGQIAA